MSPGLIHAPGLPLEVQTRASSIFAKYLTADYRRTDRMFAALLAIQWFSGVAIAIWLTPLTWMGASAQVHPHVWTAVVLGGLLSALPIYLVFAWPGRLLTRMCIAVAQMLWSALFVHLTGGRIETHFHVFGSLAFLAFYRDWRVIITATLVTFTEHSLRSIFWPMSIFGTADANFLRTIEHGGWVLFEDAFLLFAMRQRRNELTTIAERQAWQEHVQAWTEHEIDHRTRQLLTKQAELSTIHDASPMGMYLCDAFGKCDYVNRRMAEILGVSQNDCLNDGWVRTIHPEDVADTLSDWEAAFKVVNRFSRPHRILHPDGQVRWVNVTSAPIMQEGEVTGYVGTVEDITLRRLAEEQLQSAWQMLKITLDALPMRVAILDQRGRIAAMNAVCHSFAQSQGARAEELMPGCDYIGLSRRLNIDRRTGDSPVVTAIGQVLAGERDTCELEYSSSYHEEIRWFHAYIARVARGSEPLIVVSHLDVTHRMRAEQELRDAKEAAQAANYAKSAFLANMSHELRTPMAAILGFIDILIGNLHQVENMQAAQTIQRNAEYLLRLINDILDLSKIESGKLEAESIRVSPRELVQDVVSLMEVRAAAKNLALRLEIVGSLPATIQTDPLRLRQVLVNLLGNAIKFTEMGEVRLVVKLVASGGAPPCLRLEVHDTGVGMTENQLDRLFQPFTQADSSTTRKYGGTGLGLSISKRLTQLLGGDIEVQSKPGQGSMFVVTIQTGPLADIPLVEAHSPPESLAPTLAPLASCAGMRLLLAEDGPDNQRLITFLLRKAGAHVTVVDNGQQAVENTLTAEVNDQPFDVVLMDMQMPVLDGYSATRTLREHGYTRPIIALTAHAMSGDREACLAVGCDDYATKPVQRHLLLSLVAKYSPQDTGAGV